MISNTVYIGGTRYKWIDQFAKSDEWKAIESYANSNSLALPTDTIAFDQLIKDLKSAGIWQKLDVFYVFAGDGSNGFKLINWVNPEEHYADAYGGLTWDLDGVKGNSSNGYIDTNFNPAVSGMNYTLNDASRFAVITEEGTGNTVTRNIDGVAEATANGLINTTQAAQRINQGTNTLNSSADLSGTGLITINRNSNIDVLLTNKNTEINRTATSTSVTPYKQLIIKRSTTYSDLKISCYGMGSALTYAETQSFRTIYNNFLTALGLTPVA